MGRYDENVFLFSSYLVVVVYLLYLLKSLGFQEFSNFKGLQDYIQKKWDDIQKKWDDIQKKWDDIQKKWDDIQKKWDENVLFSFCTFAMIELRRDFI